MPTPDEHLELEELAHRCGVDPVAHSVRFRKVANRYPRVVAAAYGGDVAAALADSDDEVAARVATWEQEHGLEQRDWRRIGAEERADLGDGDDG
jgi:hypothetical protein